MSVHSSIHMRVANLKNKGPGWTMENEGYKKSKELTERYTRNKT